MSECIQLQGQKLHYMQNDIFSTISKSQSNPIVACTTTSA